MTVERHVKMPPHPWTHLIEMQSTGEHKDSIFGPEYEFTAELTEIRKGKSGYRRPQTRQVVANRDEFNIPIGRKTAAKIISESGLPLVDNLRRPSMTIDAISLNLVLAEDDALQALFNLFINAKQGLAFTEEFCRSMTLRLNDGFIRVKQEFAEARFEFGAIVTEIDLPVSIAESMRGGRLSQFVEHSSIPDEAVATHVIEKNGQTYIEYDVHAITLGELFGPVERYLHLPTKQPIPITIPKEMIRP